MSIDDLIDIHSTAIRRRDRRVALRLHAEADKPDDMQATRFKSKDYMDDYINPPEVLKAEEDERRKAQEQAARSFPEQPEKDVLLFLIEHAPLKGWQRDVLSIVRDEAYYFTPQGQTKIMNEGWASYWHSHHHDAEGPVAVGGDRLRRPPLRHDGHVAHPAQPLQAGHRASSRHRACAGTRGGSARNTTSATTWTRSATWDTQLGLGRQKIFEVRRVHNDITFIDTLPDARSSASSTTCSRSPIRNRPGSTIIESRDFEKIKQRLLFSLTNFGKPWIYVVDGNYRNRGELLLKHVHTGVELRLDQAADTLANIQNIWSRPVHLHTLVDGKPTTLSFDGTDHSIRTGGESDDSRRTAPAKTR